MTERKLWTIAGVLIGLSFIMGVILTPTTFIRLLPIFGFLFFLVAIVILAVTLIPKKDNTPIDDTDKSVSDNKNI
jgi:phage shock protein PspC (stress-responsive transcriptional regulator)